MGKFDLTLTVSFTKESIEKYQDTYPMLNEVGIRPFKVVANSLEEIGSKVHDYLEAAFADVTAQARRVIQVSKLNNLEIDPKPLSVFMMYLTIDDFYANTIYQSSVDSQAVPTSNITETSDTTDTPIETINEESMPNQSLENETVDFVAPTTEEPDVIVEQSTPAPKKRRKRRTKAEIEADRLAKQAEKETNDQSVSTTDNSSIVEDGDTEQVSEKSAIVHTDPFSNGGLKLDDDSDVPNVSQPNLSSILASAMTELNNQSQTVATQSQSTAPISQKTQEQITSTNENVPQFNVEQPVQPTIQIMQPTYKTTAVNANLINGLTQILKATPTPELPGKKMNLLIDLVYNVVNPGGQNPQLPAPSMQMITSMEEYNALCTDIDSLLGAFDYILHG